MNGARRRRNVLAVVLFWCVILLGVGVGHRWLGRASTAALSTPVSLEKPLATLPTRIGSWKGVDVPVNERVLEVAGNDDYVNRRYFETGSRQVVDFHLAYTARPANMLGHRPGVCYPAHGWTHVATRSERVQLADGAELQCLIHRFSREQPEPEGLVVLNYYVLQGRRTTEWTGFWGPKWRRPNLSRDPNFYVAQVQVTSATMLPTVYDRAEQVVKRFAAEAAPHVSRLLPPAQKADVSPPTSPGAAETSQP